MSEQMITVTTDSFTNEDATVRLSWQGSEKDSPEGGETFGWNWMLRGREPEPRETTHWGIPSTMKCRWQPELLEWSNHESLVRDYEDYLVLVSYQNGESLAVKVGAEIPKSLYEAIAGLTDYAVYDEHDYSIRETCELTEYLDSLEWSVCRDVVASIDSPNLTTGILHDAYRAGVENYLNEGLAYNAEEVRESDVLRVVLEEVRKRLVLPVSLRSLSDDDFIVIDLDTGAVLGTNLVAVRAPSDLHPLLVSPDAACEYAANMRAVVPLLVDKAMLS